MEENNLTTFYQVRVRPKTLEEELGRSIFSTKVLPSSICTKVGSFLLSSSMASWVWKNNRR